MVVHNELGEFLTLRTVWVEPLLEPKVGEAYGLVVAMEWIKDLDAIV